MFSLNINNKANVKTTKVMKVCIKHRNEHDEILRPLMLLGVRVPGFVFFLDFVYTSLFVTLALLYISNEYRSVVYLRFHSSIF